MQIVFYLLNSLEESINQDQMVKVKLPFYSISNFNVTLDLLVHIGFRSFLCLLGS